MSTVDVRCPIDSRRLFARLLLGDARVSPDNLIEVACVDCKKARRRAGEPVAQVLHRYNVLGEHVETKVVDAG